MSWIKVLSVFLPPLHLLVIFVVLVSNSHQISINKVTSEENLEDATTTTTENPKNYWVPDIWGEMGFPVVPEDPLPLRYPLTESPATDLNINEFKLKVIDNRIAGGRIPCQCGSPRQRIIDGEPARINDIPWTVAITRKGSTFDVGGPRPFCGGTLINDRYVITASHCVDRKRAELIQIVVNEEDFLITSDTVGKTQRINVQEIIMHPGYVRKNADNDVALIKLVTPVTFAKNGSTPFVVPVCLPASNGKDFSNTEATIAGWGTRVPGGPVSSTLHKVNVPILTNELCNSNETLYTGKISENMLCAGNYMVGGKDSCQGDSGGPLIINNGGHKMLVGVVSFGYGCGIRRAPGVYARVGRYPTWILSNTRDAEWCES